MSDNPLVVTESNLQQDPGATPDGIKGVGLAESGHDLYSGISEGSWVSAGLGAAGLAMEGVSMAVDPIGTLISYGLSWLIEHVEPLKEALDWFAGDPDGVRAYGQTWGQVSEAVKTAVQDYQSAVESDTARWKGMAGDAYREHAAEKADAITAAGEMAGTLSSVVTIMAEVVSLVREFVRDLVSETISAIITYALEAVCSFGLATPVIVGQVAAKVARVTKLIGDKVTALIDTIKRVAPMIGRAVKILAKVIKKLMGAGDEVAEKVWKKVDDTFGTNAVGKHQAKFGGGSGGPDGASGSDSDGASGSDGGSGSDGSYSGDGSSSDGSSSSGDSTSSDRSGGSDPDSAGGGTSADGETGSPGSGSGSSAAPSGGSSTADGGSHSGPSGSSSSTSSAPESGTGSYSTSTSEGPGSSSSSPSGSSADGAPSGSAPSSGGSGTSPNTSLSGDLGSSPDGSSGPSSAPNGGSGPEAGSLGGGSSPGGASSNGGGTNSPSSPAPSSPATTSASNVDAPPAQSGPTAPASQGPSSSPSPSGGGMSGGVAGGPAGAPSPSGPGGGGPTGTSRPSGGGWTGTPGSPGAAGRPPSPGTEGLPRPRTPEPAAPSAAPRGGTDAPARPGSGTPNAPGRTGEAPSRPDTPDSSRPPEADTPKNGTDPDSPENGSDQPNDPRTDRPEPGTPEYEQKIDEGVRSSERTDAGMSGHDDPNMQDLARRVPDDGTHFTVDAHHSPDGVQLGGRNYSPDELADVLRRSGWDGKSPIRLLSCDSSEFAGDLARKLGVDVTAPNGKAWSDGNGNVFASTTTPDGGPTWPPDGGWDTHHPDGSNSPASNDAFHPSRDGETPGDRPEDAEARGRNEPPRDSDGRVDFKGRGSVRVGQDDGSYDLYLNGERYPESARHIFDAQGEGHPSELSVDQSADKKSNQDSRRDASLDEFERKVAAGEIPDARAGNPNHGLDRDEYPPARMYEGGNRGTEDAPEYASVRLITGTDNQASGSAWWNHGVKGLPDGTQINVIVEKPAAADTDPDWGLPDHLRPGGGTGPSTP